MGHGKPWAREDEQTLVKLVKRGKSPDVIAKALGKTVDSVCIKMRRLGLKAGVRVVVDGKMNQPSTSSPEVPEELPSVGEIMRRLTVALKALEVPGLEKQEIVRLRCLILGFKIYKELFADFVHYCDIEAELVELRKGYDELLAKKKDDAAKPNVH